MVDQDISEDDIRAALSAVVGSDSFVRSPQLIEFLTYIVESKLCGNEAQIKAYSIAVDVFKRPVDFDPQSDSSVRVQAGRLRTFLNKFNAANESKLPVLITLPRGRYVPEFIRTPDSGRIGASAVSDSSGDGPPPSAPSWLISGIWGGRYTLAVIAVVGILLIAGLGAGAFYLATQFGLFQAGQVRQATLAERIRAPILVLGEFTNHTDLSELENELSAAPRRLAAALAKFGDIELLVGAQTDNLAVNDRTYLLSGSLRGTERGIEFTLLLTRASTSTVVWGRTIFSQVVRDSYDAAIIDVVRRVAGELGSLRGPVHRLALNGLPSALTEADSVSPYICELYFELGFESGAARALQNVRTCYQNILLKTPEDRSAQLSLAALDAHAVLGQAAAGDILRAVLFEVATRARTIVSGLPQDSRSLVKYAFIQQGAGAFREARRGYIEAISQNPSDSVAYAAFARYLAVNGEWGAAVLQSNAALELLPDPPPWYFTVRTFDTFRRNQFNDALNLAVVLVAADREFGSIIALAAAPGAARGDSIDRLRADVLSQENFQKQGIMPRLSVRIRDEAFLGLIRIGLSRAGFGADILDRGFDYQVNAVQ